MANQPCRPLPLGTRLRRGTVGHAQVLDEPAVRAAGAKRVCRSGEKVLAPPLRRNAVQRMEELS